MPNIAFLLAVVAAILIVYGRMARRNRVAIAGFAALALAAVSVTSARDAHDCGSFFLEVSHA